MLGFSTLPLSASPALLVTMQHYLFLVIGLVIVW